MYWFMASLCGVAVVLAVALALIRWWRNPEYLRWIRIEQRARTRAAAQRAAEKYAALPAVTVRPPLEPRRPDREPTPSVAEEERAS